jgi:hypothetical protein
MQLPMVSASSPVFKHRCSSCIAYNIQLTAVILVPQDIRAENHLYNILSALHHHFVVGIESRTDLSILVHQSRQMARRRHAQTHFK